MKLRDLKTALDALDPGADRVMGKHNQRGENAVLAKIEEGDDDA